MNQQEEKAAMPPFLFAGTTESEISRQGAKNAKKNELQLNSQARRKVKIRELGFGSLPDFLFVDNLVDTHRLVIK